MERWWLATLIKLELLWEFVKEILAAPFRKDAP